MNTFGRRIEPAVTSELRAAAQKEAAGDGAASFRHLERAHVLGQASTVQHVRVHVQMLLWAVRHRVSREAAGRVLRIIGAATKTAIGWVPTGNTGGSNISPFRPVPIPADLQKVLDSAHAARHR
ncbi:DUF3703 domain-containing protein [Ramlibacter terrae]|uniref:DUF3703 domain-containing protein n=1 Tax=Ramlibacter terrae TaxID=2732511 RepID=A0ABX6P7V1_9BURK|nr:DUF3703 domain-containing protein [Ramlibacter terrae]